jgi:hypothetical protein
MEYSTHNNQDLMKYANVCDSDIQVDNSTLNPTNNGIEYDLFIPVIRQIAKHQDRLGKNKDFAVNFIKTLRGKSSVSFKQMKVLRDLQKQCDPEYLKVPKKVWG